MPVFLRLLWETVSYTHLDVYKRQDVISRLLIDAMPGTMISQSKQELDAAKADLERARLVREALLANRPS